MVEDCRSTGHRSENADWEGSILVYKVDDEFFNQVDVLLDSITDMCQATDTLENAGVAIINIQKWTDMRDKAAKVLDSMNDGFDSAEGEKENEEGVQDC